MKHLKMLGLVTLSALALMSLAGTGTTSATTLEIGGVTKNESILLTTSTKAGTSALVRDTFGFLVRTCAEWNIEASTISPYTGSIVTASVSAMSFNGCEHTVTVHKPGQLYVEWTSGTNGRVYSELAEVTVYSTLHGTHLNCTSGTGTLIGTLTGVKEGHATLDVNATLTCAPHLHSIKWTGTYILTSPTGLGVSS